MKKLIICALAVLTLSGCSKTPEEKNEDLFQNGIVLIENFNYESADSSFNQIFDIDPVSVKGLLGVAKVSEARLQYFDAINSYSMLLSVSTDYEDAFVGLYNSYKKLGFYHEALETAVHYNKVWHSNTHTKYYLGEAFMNIGDFKRANTYFKQAVVSGYKDKNAAQAMLATTLALQGLYKDADSEITAARSDNPDTDIFYNAASEYYETIGLLDTAMYFNKKISDFNKSNIQNKYTSFRRALKNNYLSDARIIVENLKTLKVEPLVLEGFNLFYALHIDDKSLIRAHGQNYRFYAPKSLTGRMYELYSRGEISDKLTISQDLEALKTELGQGTLSEEFGSFYYFAMLMNSVKYEKNPTTISDLESIQGIRVNRKLYKLELALTKHIIGLFDESYEDLRKIESGHSANAEWLVGIADVWSHFAVRKYNKAEETLNKALAVNQYYLPAFNNYIELLTRIDKPKEALKLFEIYPQFENNKFVALTKTKYLFLNKKYKDGIKQFKQFYPFANGNIVLVNELVEILKADNRKDDINTILELVNQENSDANLLLSSVAQENNEFEKSMTYILKTLETEPNNPTANIFKARALYYTGKKTEAYDLFEQNLTTFTKNPLNLKYYSQILANEGIDFGKAANMARQATFEGYGNYEYLINLSEVYYKMGRFDLSRGESNKARTTQALNPYGHFRYGIACYMSKDKEMWSEKAKESLLKAKKLGLSGENLKEANSALKNL